MTPLPIGFSLLLGIFLILSGMIFKYFSKSSMNMGAHLHHNVKMKKRDRDTVSIIIVIIIIFSFTAFYGFTISNAIKSPENNLELAQRILTKCEPLLRGPIQEKKVILRLDDVQAYGWRKVSTQIIKDANYHNMPVVVGVISKTINDDIEMVKFLQHNICKNEIAIHGYDNINDENEFKEIDHLHGSKLIKLSKKNLRHITKKDITTIIPPNNVISNAARAAAYESGITVISEASGGYFDYDTSWLNFFGQQFISAEHIINNCERVYSAGDNICVVLIHPQDFSTADQELDAKLYNEFIKMLQYFSQRPDISPVTFNEIANTKP